MNRDEPDNTLTNQLKQVGLRPTRQRLELLQLLCGNGDRHVTPENLHLEARDNGIRVSLATVYNTLNQFTDKQLLRRLITESGVTWFDTNTSNHHHFYNEVTGDLTDFPADACVWPQLPDPPAGKTITGLNIVVSIR
ncbi:MAG: iron response transcriptional regulator IrrA [Pseudomonadota bacterium]